MTDSQLDPITKTLDVDCPTQQAFEYFTAHMADWWPLHSHAVSPPKTGKPAKSCVMEPRVGGRVYEIGADDHEHEWGIVQIWEPGQRVTWSWYPGRPSAQATEIELRFEETGAATARLTLEHRYWERLGEEGADLRAGYQGGWDVVLVESFGGFAAEQTRAA